MVKDVEEHIAVRNGGFGDQLNHLAWLCITGHYAIERILESDRSHGLCWLSLDVSSSIVLTYSITRSPYPMSRSRPTPTNSERALRPAARQIVVRLLDTGQPGGGTVIHPTG